MDQHIRGTNRHRYIYLIRHGDYERTDEVFGGVLTDRGVEQARCLIEPLSKIPVDAIYSSTMNRAHQTAQIIAEGCHPELPVQRTPWLNERLLPGFPDREPNRPEYDRESRETLDKVWARFFRPSRSERHDVLVCHGNIIRALLMRAVGAPLEQWYFPSIAQCGITQLVSDKTDRTRLISFNERGHHHDVPRRRFLP